MLSSYLIFALTITQLIAAQGLLSYTRRHSYPSAGFVGQTPPRRTTRQPAQEPDPEKEEVLTNDLIIKLLKAGIDEDLVIAKVQKTKHNFDLSTDGLIALKQAGATSRLIQFMMDPSKPPAAKGPPSQPVLRQNPICGHFIDLTASDTERWSKVNHAGGANI